jgi:hypothetical protein
MKRNIETPCSGPCPSYGAGHQVHFIQARLVGESPWGWRDAVVSSLDKHFARLAYLEDDATPIVWHHKSLKRRISVGDPVRLHERYHVLGCPAGWFSVVIAGGLGAVPEPMDKTVWAPEFTIPVVDLATGIALPLDHVEGRGERQ